jgi:hypothetical protein
MARRLTSAAWLLLGLAGLGLGACQAVAGIEDRKLDPAAVERMKNAAQCDEYCTRAMDACTDKNAVYTSKELCLAVCAKMDPGDSTEITNEETVACRINGLAAAEREPDDGCRYVGPGANGACGSDCDAYCKLYHRLCEEYDHYPTEGSCLQACAGLTDQNRYNLKDDHEGDTIECRLVHVSSAGLDPENHCPHAPIPPTEPWCTGKADASPTCKEYCQIELAACTGELTHYDTEKECLDACSAFELGTNDDDTGNTIGCRRYHSFSATLAADMHCPHSGPTGDGHCGDHSKLSDGASTTGNCESYCLLVAKACPAEPLALDADACMAECITLDEAEPESRYTVAKAEKSSELQSRVLHAVKAFADDSECAAAVGAKPCN